MKKLALLLTLIILASGCLGEGVKKEEGRDESHDSYKFNLKLEPERHVVRGSMKLDYRNKALRIFDEIYFNLYPNAYRDRDGYLRVKSVTQEGKPLEWRIFGKNQTLLEVKLEEPLEPGKKTRIEMEFEMGVAKFEPWEKEIGLGGVSWNPLPMRFSHNNGTYYLGNALPIVCVYDGKWHLNDYFIVESFHSEFAYYDVTLDVPSSYEACSSGLLIEEHLENGRKTLHYTSDLLREFTLVASNSFDILEGEWNGKKINIFYPEGKIEVARACLEGSKKVLEKFSEVFGEYPYKEFNVVEHPEVAMEFPCLIMVYFVEGYEWGWEVAKGEGLAHEISHQWWYVTVGNNENDESWLDEAFAVYSNILFNEWEYGKRKENAGKTYLDYIKKGGKDTPVGSEVWSFAPEGYSPIVYQKGAAVLHMLRYVVGDENFFNILRKYYEEYRFKLVKTEGFIGICEEVYGKDLNWFFDEWLNKTGYLNYGGRAGLEEKKDGGYELNLLVSQKPRFKMPLEIKIIYQSGKEETKKIWIIHEENFFTFSVDELPISITLDPGYWLLGEIERNVEIEQKLINP
jgi:hypothetical protein